MNKILHLTLMMALSLLFTMLVKVDREGLKRLELMNKILHLTLTMALSLLFTMLVKVDCEGLKSLVEHADDTVLEKAQRELMGDC